MVAEFISNIKNEIYNDRYLNKLYFNNQDVNIKKNLLNNFILKHS
jgi:hypothetical protein